MKTEIIVEKYKHYSMTEREGLSVIVRGSNVSDSNETGVQITESPVLNYNELNYLKTIDADSFPAKFTAEVEFTKVKDKVGREKTGLAFRDLKFVCKMKLVEEKA